ncbi:MAG TPA: CRTAC1 family protein, partial [Acidobacteriota bacterium]|nr:CRTAC1 family protein [Acidobacteriota bacterium]
CSLFLLMALLPVSFLSRSLSPALSNDPVLSFQDIAPQAGLLEPTIMRGTPKGDFLLSTSGGPVAAFDFNADGLMDLFLGGSGSFPGSPETAALQRSRLYENRRNGQFKEISRQVGADLEGWSQGACAGDLNNDGFVDLVVTFYGKVVLLMNQNGVRLKALDSSTVGLEATNQRWNSGCTLLDYDRDGYLDLFVACYAKYEEGLEIFDRDELRAGVSPVLAGFSGEHNYLFKNHAGEKFSDVSKETGILPNEAGLSFTPISLDYNRDGWTDLFIANDSTPNRLYLNSGDGRFEEVGLLSGVAYNEDARALAGMGVDVSDYNSDGFPDLAITNFSNQPVSLFRNFRGTSFLDVTFPDGLGDTISFVKWGINFLDYDLDGRDDLFYSTGPIYPPGLITPFDKTEGTPNLIYRNIGGRFQRIAASGEGGLPESRYCSRGSAAVDIDNDGRLEIVINNINGPPELWKINNESRHSWIGLQLEGEKTNRSAVGSRVIVKTSNGEQFKEVRAASGFCSQSDSRLHFGLGRASSAEIRIEWLSGTIQEFSDVQVLNRYLTVKEGVPLH